MGINSRYTDIKQSFWDEFPSFKIAGPFKELYKNDKTSKKSFSSTVMWALSKVCDKDSEFAQLELEERIETVFSEYLVNTTKTDWYVKYRDKLDSYMVDYMKITTTRLEKALIAHEDKFIERANYIESLSYEEHWEILEKLLPATSKLANELEEARKKVMAEQDKGINKGGVITSLSDGNSI